MPFSSLRWFSQVPIPLFIGIGYCFHVILRPRRPNGSDGDEEAFGESVYEALQTRTRVCRRVGRGLLPTGNHNDEPLLKLSAAAKREIVQQWVGRSIFAGNHVDGEGEPSAHNGEPSGGNEEQSNEDLEPSGEDGETLTGDEEEAPEGEVENWETEYKCDPVAPVAEAFPFRQLLAVVRGRPTNQFVALGLIMQDPNDGGGEAGQAEPVGDNVDTTLRLGPPTPPPDYTGESSG